MSSQTKGLRSTIAVVIVAATVSFFGGYLLRGDDTGPQLPGAALSSVTDCVKANLASTQPAKVDNALLKESSELCYSQIHGQGLLNDFQIRRLKFLQQAYDERILLWMVVAITLSGVFLAGMQLLASYQLASSGRATFGDSGELSLENNKVSLKSSIAGLFILIFSFAFFSVFVYEIYKIKDIDVDRGTKTEKAIGDQQGEWQQQRGHGLSIPAQNTLPPRIGMPSRPNS